MSVLIRQDLFEIGTLMWPNQSPEPTASAAAIYARGLSVRLAAVTRWLSFFR